MPFETGPPERALLRDTEQAAFLRSEPLDKLGTGFASVSKDAAPGARSDPSSEQHAP